MMQLLIPIAAILILVGSFMWFRPSLRDQYLTKLRAEALRNGFRLGTIKIPDYTDAGLVNDSHTLVTVYYKGLTFLKTDEPLRFTIARTEGDSGIFLPDHWAWVERAQLTKSMQSDLNALLMELPNSVEATTVNNQQVGLSWSEREGALELSDISRLLQRLAHVIGRQINGTVNT